MKGNIWVNRLANILSGLILIQFVWGAMTLLTLAPIILQLGHLLLADLIWIAFILLSANVLTERNAVEINSPAVFERQGALN